MSRFAFKRSLLRAAFLLLGLLSAAGVAVGADESLPQGRFAFRSYGTEQGLGNLAPSLLLQDRQGYIWVGTEDGLYRYDGQKFQPFDRRSGLPSTFITAIHEDAKGVLWVGTYQGLARKDGRMFVTVKPEEGIGRIPVEGLASDAANQLWVANSQGLFVSRSHSGFELAKGWPGGEATAVHCRPGSTRVWAASWQESGKAKDAKLLQFDGQRWQAINESGGALADRVDCVLEDPKGRLWARTRRELWGVQAGEGTARQVPLPWSSAISARAALSVNKEGELFIPTDNGILISEKGRWNRLAVKEGLPVEWARDVLEDREGSLWVASLGVHRLLGRGAWLAYTAKEGLPSEVAWTFFRDRDRRFWIGTDKGLARGTGKGWEVIPGTERTVVRTIVEDPEGRLYLAGAPVEVLRLDPRTRRIEHFGQEAGLFGRRIFRLVLDRAGNLWAATDGGGLFSANVTGKGPLRFQNVILPGGRAQEYISGLALDGEGRLWVSGDAGLAVLDGGQWKRFTDKDGLLQTHVAYTFPTKGGELYIAYFEATGLTVARYAGGRLQINHKQMEGGSLANQKVYMIGEDAGGHIWIGTGVGVLMLTNSAEEHFGLSDGLVGEDCNNMAFLGEPNGDVWVGTSAGAARFDAQAWTGSPVPPETAVLSVRLGDTTWDSVPKEMPKVPHGANTFECRFASLSFVRETAIQYETRLVGVEPEWHSTETREVRFPALPPGAYRFEVRSRIGNGDWGSTTGLDFRILPAWWQTWWFRGLVVLLTVGLGGLIVWLRIEALRRHNRHLEEMVNSRTQELKAANEALRNQSLTDPLTGLRNRRYLGVCMPEDIAQVVRTHRNVSRGQSDRTLLNIDLVFLMVDVDHFKMVNDKYGHHAGDLVLQQLADILRRATRDTDTVVRWGGEEFLIVARNASRGDSTVLAERIRAGVEAHDFDIGGEATIHRTCSVGYAFYPFLVEPPEAFSWEQVVDLADHCLFAAKRGGRNAWVGISPANDFRAEEVPQRISAQVKQLVDAQRLQVRTSLDPSIELEWDLSK
jgi:diguanylate cyclase (GGDEF)-like protein